MTHWNDVINRTAVLTVENAALANQGIYSASFVGDSPLHGAWMRLIVRGLLDPDIHQAWNEKYTQQFALITVRLCEGVFSLFCSLHTITFNKVHYAVLSPNKEHGCRLQLKRKVVAGN